MTSKETVVIPTGFLKVSLLLDKALEQEALTFIRSGVYLTDVAKNYFRMIPLPVNKVQVIPLKEGLYKVQATLGEIESKEVNVEVKAGDIAERVFCFGKETQL